MMIRSIAAIDRKRGIATNAGIPWDLPIDVAHFRKHTRHGIVLMGLGFYAELDQPLPDRQNVVANDQGLPLKPGFIEVKDARQYLQSARQSGQDVWVSGGAGLYASTLDLVDELYLTQIDGDFNCTKFFPDFSKDFELVQTGPDQQQNGLTFRFQIWRRKP